MDKKIKINKNIKILIILSLALMVGIIGLTYAYFEFEVIGNDTASSVGGTTSNGRLIYNDVQVVLGTDGEPGWTETKTLTVTNEDATTRNYTINWREVLNTVELGELVISATCSASSGSCSNISEIQVPSTEVEVTDVYTHGPVSIGPGVTHTYTLTFLFKEINSPQDYNRNKQFYGTLNIKEVTLTPTSCFTTTTSNMAEGTIKVLDYTCSETDIIIPSEINNKTVTVLEGLDNLGLTSVIIPNTVTSITIMGFKDNQLTSVVIPSSVTNMCSYAFSNNQIKTAIIPNSLTTLPAACFKDNQLTSVAIPSSVTNIEYSAFTGNQLSLLILPSNVQYLGNYAFENNQLSSLTLQSGLLGIGDNAFRLNKLTSVVIPNSVTSIGQRAFQNNLINSLVISNNITSIGLETFRKNKLESVTIPSKVATIGNSAFRENLLTTVTIPSNVDTIGTMAFYNNNLKTVKIAGKTSSSEFTSYTSGSTWGWASDVTCTKDNTSNVSNGCITWLGSGS